MDGTVVAGPGFSPSNVTVSTTINITETGFVDEETFGTLISIADWDSEWDPAVVKQKLNDNFVRVEGQVMSAVPSPLPPDEYDPLYKPDFWIFLSAQVEEVLGAIHAVDGAIEDEVRRLIVKSVLMGAAGLLIFLLMVGLVAQILTRPLNWIEMTAWKIVNHADKRVSNDVVVLQYEERDPLVRCSPKTEIWELVSEFQTMIHGFSGNGASRVAPSKMEELMNFVTWKEGFSQLHQLNQTMEDKIKEEMNQKAQSYGRRISLTRGSRGSSNGVTSEASEEAHFRSAELRQASPELRQGDAFAQFGRTNSSTMFQRPSTRTNVGSNLPTEGTYGEVNGITEKVRISRSSLFIWVLGSIVVPLLLTNMVICALVAHGILNSFPKSMEKADNVSYSLGIDSLRNSATLRAMHAEQILPGSLRDLHLVTRIAGWVLFDALDRSDSFTETEVEMVEECKRYSDEETCPFETNNTRSPCDCDWNDPWRRQCQDFSIPTRQRQKLWYMCQARDFDPETGRRNESLSFPEYDFNALSTRWWINIAEMPGAYKGVNASGYATTYDRLRVLSAISTAALPIYNYFNNNRGQTFRTSLSSYVAFESDGAYIGYAGCNYDFARYAHFKSGEENKAFLVNPELCPFGKFGYDPRCRTWYADTKRKAMASGDPIHVSEPYVFATVNDVGSSAASPLIDPRTGEYVGTSLIDLSTTEIFQNLEKVNSDFYFVISPESSTESDTVVGPEHDIGDSPAAIADVVLRFDKPDSANRAVFANITRKMKAGLTGNGSFHRKTSDGFDESVQLSFAPVYARVLKPVRPDDFSRGAEVSRVLLYSVGIAQTNASLRMPFLGIEGDIDASLEWCTIIFVSSVAAITFICILITAKVSGLFCMFCVLLHFSTQTILFTCSIDLNRCH
jgi:hypothetical protein